MITFIDGDVLCYLACKSRYANEKNNIVVNGVEKPQFTMAQDAAYLEQSWKNLKGLVQECQDALYATAYLMAVKSEYNFRDEIFPVWWDELANKWQGYKGNRVKALEDTNEFVPELRSRLVENNFAIESTGREADDLVSIWSKQAIDVGEKFSVATNDKDMAVIASMAIEPVLFYNPKTKATAKITPGVGLKFFYLQLLMGDTTDNIPGVKGIGPKKAEKLLADCIDEDDYRFVVMEIYQTAYDSEWRDQLLSNGKLLYLQKHSNDYFNLADWIEI